MRICNVNAILLARCTTTCFEVVEEYPDATAVPGEPIVLATIVKLGTFVEVEMAIFNVELKTDHR